MVADKTNEIEQFKKATEVTKTIAKEIIDYIGYLYCRWLDEKEYEDFADYQTALIKKFIEVAATHNFITTNHRVSKRPFGIEFVINGFKFQISVKAKSYSMKCLGKA